ncbi:MAG TPA: ABC transporter permease [Blastocatellia bacterium]|nr:ABC transporter permease [Blastocatellia bacterium]
MDNLLQDIRYSIRVLMKHPGFLAAAMVSLSLAIGANGAIFSVINAVLVRPLPFHDPDRIVKVWEMLRSKGNDRRSVAYPNFVDWRDQNRVFEEIAAIYPTSFNLTGDQEPERVRGELVSSSYFPLLGVQAAMGRTFLPEEDATPDANPVTVISYDLWQRRYGGSRDLLGKAIKLNDREYTVVGIMPKGFKGSTGDKSISATADLWLPIMMVSSIRPAAALGDRGVRWHEVIARLKPGVTLKQASADMDAISQHLEEQYKDTNGGRGVLIVPLRDEAFGNIRPALLVLWGAAGFVLLIACANVANLLLARATNRKREIAIRLALGANRRRLIQQLLTESVILASLGGVLGLVLASWSLSALVNMIPVTLPSFTNVSLDIPVLIIIGLLSLLSGIFFGLAPALASSKPDFVTAIKEGSKSGPRGNNRLSLRNAFVVAEVAIALVLLVGAGLMIKSFRRIQAVDPGFSPDRLLSMRINLPPKRYTTPQALAFARQLTERIQPMPSVESFSLASDIPLGEISNAMYALVEGRPADSPNSESRVYHHRVSPHFFTTMGIPVLQGRDFNEQDSEQSLKTVIIDQTLAKNLWPGEDPLGKRIKAGAPDSPWMTIVGVVGDVKYRGVPNNPDSDPDVYMPLYQGSSLTLFMLARTNVDPSQMISSLKREVQGLDPQLTVFNIATMQARIDNETSHSRFNAQLLAILSMLALALAMVGIYSVINYSVTQRYHEIGIRMALGAQRTDILKLVVGQGMVLVITGIIIGLTLAFISTRLLGAMLYGISGTDWFTYLETSLLLAAVAATACYVPAHRASKVDPIVVLRYE